MSSEKGWIFAARNDLEHTLLEIALKAIGSLQALAAAMEDEAKRQTLANAYAMLKNLEE